MFLKAEKIFAFLKRRQVLAWTDMCKDLSYRHS